MARCQGMQCDKIHIPYVDTYLRKSQSTTEVKTLLTFDSPSVPINVEGHCKPQEFNGVCNVFNCPWVEFNTEETNSAQVNDYCDAFSDKYALSFVHKLRILGLLFSSNIQKYVII